MSQLHKKRKSTKKNDPRKQPHPGYAERNPNWQFPVGSGTHVKKPTNKK